MSVSIPVSSYLIAGGSSVSIGFDVTSLVISPPLSLSASDTVFIHAFTFAIFKSTKSVLDSSF